MPIFYFTYGTEGHPFVGGWTEIIAPDINTACAVFRIFHPDQMEGILNCCWVYTEEQFKETKMAGPKGNYNRFCHEKITVTRTVNI